MSFEPTVTEQERLAETFRRRETSMTRREGVTIAALAVAFFAAVAAVVAGFNRGVLQMYDLYVDPYSRGR